MDLQTIVIWIIVGGVAGTLADWLVSGINLGCIGSVIVGILGAFVGGWLFSVLGIHIGTGIVNSIITAFVGALILLIILRLVRRA
jgi:uncharacterized membrane protein YeaQ/YmgE (transglycosylase-associated protein family)